MSQKLDSRLRQYKSHMHSRNKQKSPYSKKRWKPLTLLRKDAPCAHCWAEQTIVSGQLKVLFMKDDDSPSSSCHVTKMNS